LNDVTTLLNCHNGISIIEVPWPQAGASRQCNEINLPLLSLAFILSLDSIEASYQYLLEIPLYNFSKGSFQKERPNCLGFTLGSPAIFSEDMPPCC
jgi:hypothetical protein